LQVALILRNVGGGLGREHGKLSDLIGHHRKPRRRFPPRRLDFCIQGEQAGLLGEEVMTLMSE